MIGDASMVLSYQKLLRSWVQAVRQAFLGDHRSTDCSSDDLDDILKPIVGIMMTLFRYTKESIPLEHNKIFLAVPDFVTTTTRSLSLQIQPLLREAGLESFGKHYRRQSQAALLNLYDLEDCHGIPVDENTEVPDKECEVYDGRSIQSALFAAVDGTSLTLRSLMRDDGMFYADRGAAELLWKDEEIEDEAGYFAWVDRGLRKFLETQHVAFDLLVLSGTKATASELQDIIQDVLKDNDNIRPEDYLRSEQDHAFAAARGAAALARMGMCNDFDACLPNLWCPISEHCSKWVWHRGHAEGGKREL